MGFDQPKGLIKIIKEKKIVGISKLYWPWKRANFLKLQQGSKIENKTDSRLLLQHKWSNKSISNMSFECIWFIAEALIGSILRSSLLPVSTWRYGIISVSWVVSRLTVFTKYFTNSIESTESNEGKLEYHSPHFDLIAFWKQKLTLPMIQFSMWCQYLFSGMFGHNQIYLSYSPILYIMKVFILASKLSSSCVKLTMIPVVVLVVFIPCVIG